MKHRRWIAARLARLRSAGELTLLARRHALR
jgi:hypothetical protein